MDYISVIYLGQEAKQPLIRLSSELSYRLEPHGYLTPVSVRHRGMVQPGGGEGCTRGGAVAGWPEGYYTGY